MKFSYSYPALIRCVPPGCRTRKSVFVVESDVADIPVLDADEVPVACAFWLGGRSHVYRYRDGAFYVPAGAARFRQDGVGRMPRGALAAIELSLVMDADADAGGNGRDVWPSTAYRHISMVSVYRGSRDPLEGDMLRVHDTGDEAREFGRKHVFPLAELGKIDADDLEFWRARSKERAEASFVFDGEMWTRAAEPYIMLRRCDTMCDCHCDADMYRFPSSRFANLPRPFGTLDRPLGLYFEDLTRTLPFSELDRAAAAMDASPDHVRLPYFAGQRQSLSRVEVSMPEVFGHGHAALELDRQARIAVSSERWLHKRSQQAMDFEGNVSRAVRRVKARLPVPGGVVTDAMADALDGYADALASGSSPDFEPLSKNLRELVSDWRSRPISLEGGDYPSPLAGG